MTELQQQFPSGTVGRRGRAAMAMSGRTPRVALTAIGLAMIIAASAFIAIVLNRAPAAQERPALAQGQVVDGWMPAISAANRRARLAEAEATRDGWSSYLLRAEQPVIDGWSVRYLNNGK